MTAAINTWLETQDAAWIEHLAPKALDEPRFASLRPPLLQVQQGISEAEALKFNLLAAREEGLSADTRVGAFFAVVVDLAYLTGDVQKMTDVYLSAARIKVLPDERRARFVTNAAKFQIGRGETALLEALAADPLCKLLHEDRRRSLQASLEALRLADSGGAAWEAGALSALSDAPLDDLRVACARHVVDRLSHAGEFARAQACVAAAKDYSVDANFVESTIPALRLGWTRAIRRVQEQSGFATALQGILATIPGADAPVPPKIRTQIGFGSSHRLTPAEHVLEAVHVLSHGYLVGEVFTAVPLFALSDAQSARARDPMLFPRILDLALSAPGTDADRAQWVVGAMSGCDIDQPEVLRRVDAALVAFQRSPEAASRPQTARAVALARAYVALRTDRQANPAAVFADPERSGVLEVERRPVELHFLVTRGRLDDSVRLSESLPTEVLMQPQVFRIARNGLLAAGHAEEVALLDEAMRDQLGRAMGELWMYPDRTYNRSWLYVARALEARDLVPPAWFDRAVGSCATDLARGALRVHQAHLEGDWPALKEACDTVLREVPDMYDVFYDRALARYHLGDRTGAGEDLRVMLTHSLSHEDYQQALKLFHELVPDGMLTPDS